MTKIKNKNKMDGVQALNYILENNLDGVIVECGVESGYFEFIWIRELLRKNERRHIYMYDTFSGLTKPGSFDFTADTAKLYKMSAEQVLNTWQSYNVNENLNRWCYAPLEKVKTTLESTGYPKEYLHYIQGDVMETLKIDSNLPEKIAILRLDTDWYESSKYELERLFDRVVQKGVVIFDDYYHWDGQRKATDEFFEKIGYQPKYVNIGNNKTSAIIKE